MAFARFGKYQAAGNFFWVNHRFTVHKGVPTNRGAVKSLMRTLARTREFNHTLVISVPADGTLDLGNLRRVSPQEYDDAPGLKFMECRCGISCRLAPEVACSISKACTLHHPQGRILQSSVCVCICICLYT